MSDPFLGEIKMGGFNYAPIGFAFCNGQLIPIEQNTALFSLLGTTYGGDGVTTFALPDLQGRAPVHQGTGPGRAAQFIGEAAGEENHTLTTAELASHTHPVSVSAAASGEDATTGNPPGQVPAVASAGGTPVNAYTSTATASMAVASQGSTGSSGGGNQPHNNLQPFLTVNFIIAVEGVFPSRN